MKDILAVIVGFSVIVAVGLGMWAAGVALAPVFGKGEAFKQQQRSTNRIASQERFEDLSADISVAGDRIAALDAAAKAAPDDHTARVNATGARTYCLELVARYNADARKYTAAQFRAADLPSSFDAATTCK